MAALSGVTSAGARWSCPVNAVSGPAWRLLTAHSDLRVHSVYSTAVHLRAGGRLVTCTSGGERAPHGVDVSPPGLPRLRQAGLRGGGTLRWHADADPAVPLVYDPTVPVVPADAAVDGALRLLGHLSRVRPTTGFGDDWPGLTRDPVLSIMVASASSGVVDDAVISSLGSGPGLTPSSDDVLVGAICALWSTAAVDAPRLAALDELLETRGRDFTTDVSVEYLRYACRGMATGAVRALLSALAGTDIEPALHAVDRLKRFGHTSGIDMLLGIVIALTTDLS